MTGAESCVDHSGKIHRTKTDQIHRVDMSDTLIGELANLKGRRQADYLARGINKIPVWVFANSEGDPADMHNIKNCHFHKCLAKAGLRQIRFHDLPYLRVPANPGWGVAQIFV